MKPGSACSCRPRLALWAGVLLALAGSGCRDSELDTVYGKRRGVYGGASVNGVGVLAGMFEEAGFRVLTKRHLCPKFDSCQVVVWAPNDLAPPDAKTRQFFERWLRTGSGRTLVYIGRDYDAAGAYWDHVQPLAPPEQAVEVVRRSAQARVQHAQAVTERPREEDGGWFRVQRDQPKRFLGRRSSPFPKWSGSWSKRPDLDPANFDLEIQARYEVPAEEDEPGPGDPFRSEILLAADDDVLVRRLTLDDRQTGQILLVTNGSFLLNLPLVEKEHRKLAAQLIADCGPSASQVIVLESGKGGPPVLEKEPGEAGQTGFEAFTVWPMGAILLHFVVAGLVLLVGRMAVFGRPGEWALGSASDFGKHVQALGELLERTQDVPYAQQRLTDYQEKVKRDTLGSAGRLTGRSNRRTVSGGRR
jgi:hypothetical protein